MVVPQKLKTGDKVGILAPGKAIKKTDLDFAIAVLQGWGLSVVVGENVFKSSTYLSASDDLRLADLQTMLNDPSIRAIICARGGYGTTRIVDRVDLTEFRKDPKWIVGFSDITALHLALAQAGFASMHGIMPVLFGKSDATESLESLRHALFYGTIKVQAAPSNFNRNGQCEGEIVGGNLSLIVDSLGTRSEVQTDGRILVIEEIDEYLYKVDRMLNQLRRANKFSNLKGLIVGHMTEINDSDVPFGFSVEEIVLNAVRGHDFPVAFKFPIGHEHPNLAWIHGQKMILNCSSEGLLLYPSSQQI